MTPDEPAAGRRRWFKVLEATYANGTTELEDPMPTDESSVDLGAQPPIGDTPEEAAEVHASANGDVEIVLPPAEGQEGLAQMRARSSEEPAPIILPRIISIANQKGGVGKTTTAVNLGAALAELDFRVLVIDLDPQGNATTGMGISHRNVEGSVYDVIMNDAPIEDCVEPTSVKNLFVVPGHHRPGRRRDRARARVLPRAQAARARWRTSATTTTSRSSTARPRSACSPSTDWRRRTM